MYKNKYILGLTGWYNRSHDATACIVKNGKILAMVEEERFLRKKHAYDKTPLYATLWCLNKIGIQLDDIDIVAIGWDYKKLYKINGIEDEKLNNLVEVFFPKKYFKYSKTPKIELIDHHLAHAACSYYLSGMDEASIMIIDGQGENVSGTMAVGKGSNIKIIKKFPIKDSLGYFYEAVSEFIGLGADAPGKLMGLASYGSPLHNFNQFQLTNDGYETCLSLPDIKENSLDQQQLVTREWLKILESKFGKQTNLKLTFRPSYGDVFRNIIIEQIHKDIASSAQKKLEQVLLHLVKVMVKKTGIRNVCLGGGVALNCSTNTIIAKSEYVEKYFVPPMANDIGTSVGAALYVGKIKSPDVLTHSYYGPEFSNNDINQVIKRLGCRSKKINNISEKVADLLTNGKIVSWFQGALEVGPRALGNRSILANPRLKITNQNVNLAKERELWRPLAPSILEEKIDDYLENSFISPFMLHTFQVKKGKQKEIPAVTHIDGSTRPQTVNKQVNPKFYELINNFYKKTGTPMILNTSYNGAKEPIVSTPLDAIISFYSNSTDFLAIGDYLIEK